MHIAIISRGIPTPDYPMNGIFEWDQAKALHNLGHKVTFIVLDMRSPRRKRKLFDHYFKDHDIDVVYGSMPVGACSAKLFHSLGKWKLRRLFKKSISRYGAPDIIHSHFYDISAIASVAAKGFGIPIVCTEHSSKLNNTDLTLDIKFLGKIAYSNSDRIITVSNALNEKIKSHFSFDSTVIPNIVDTSSFLNKRQKHSIFTFVSVGSLLKNKNHECLIKAFSQLHNNQNIQLLIIGKGEEYDNLKKLITDYNLQDNVKLLGFKSRNEISEVFSNSDCFVLASRRETFGVVYIEAMLAGLPVIATRCGGPEDFVNESNGILVDPDDITQLTEAMQKMIDNFNQYNSEEISRDTVEKFSPESIAKKLTNLYSEIING